MSDIKAQAEARRAKILNRNNKRTVTTVNEEDIAADVSIPIGPTTPTSRPLASRRKLIEVVKVEKEVEGEKNDNEEQQEKANLSSKLPPKKSIEEIEREVAENTAKFDANTRSKDDEGEGNSSSPSSSSKNKTTSDSSKIQLVQKHGGPNGGKGNGLDASAIMRLFRVVMILLLACFSGYTIVEKNRQEALQINKGIGSSVFGSSSTTVLHTTQEVDEFAAANTVTEDILPFMEEGASRTWIEYIQMKVRGQTECSVSAVALVWYLSRILAPAVTAPFAQKTKPTKPLEMIMDFLTNGLSGLVEGVYSTLGEVALHLFFVIVSVVGFTLYYSPAATVLHSQENTDPTSTVSEL